MSSDSLTSQPDGLGNNNNGIGTCSPLIAASTGECFLTLFNVDGTIINRIIHPYDVYGVDFSILQKNIIATGSSDGSVRVYNLGNPNFNVASNNIGIPTTPATTQTPVLVLRAHHGKVFCVKFSPLLPNLLATAGDDCIVKVYDISTQQCIAKLQGHTANVRSLIWNHELPYLLTSTGWDGSIKTWDVRNQTLLSSNGYPTTMTNSSPINNETVNISNQDIYAITAHPDRPFVYLSVSRDGMIREWYVLYYY